MALGLRCVLGLQSADRMLDRRQRRMLEARGSLDVVAGSSSRRNRGRLPGSSDASSCRRCCRAARARRRSRRRGHPAGTVSRRRRRRSRRRTRCRVELMTVPALVLQDAELRKPLRDEVEVADRAGAGERCAARAPSSVTRCRRSAPGATGPGSVTAITVRSSGFPSSGAMNRIAAVRLTSPFGRTVPRLTMWTVRRWPPPADRSTT